MSSTEVCIIRYHLCLADVRQGGLHENVYLTPI